jgi:hypothetical protein
VYEIEGINHQQTKVVLKSKADTSQKKTYKCPSPCKNDKSSGKSKLNAQGEFILPQLE